PEGFFIQGSVEIPGELAELRAYILSKILWDKDSDIDKVKTEFLKNYYGDAGVLVGQYIDLIHEHVRSSWRRMDIYDNPIMPYQNYLSPKLLTEYLNILDSAETLVKGDTEFTKRVQMVAMPLHFAVLQQARFFGIDQNGVFIKQDKKWVVREEIRTKVQQFLKLLRELQITQLNESGLSPQQYQIEWEHIFEAGPVIHKALNKPVRLLTENTPEFVSKGARTLVDGIGGTEDFQYNWLGWNETDMEVEIDMEAQTGISKIEMSFLENHRHYMFLPRAIRIELSDDGKTYEEVVLMSIDGPFEDVSAPVRKFNFDLKKAKARYIKVTAVNQTEVPIWR
ncbi:MAG TPA: discoidin domain-containing protein, partial [Daejeonella sp.]|nr:discoidin domain-containing protein [Daejeonella sp.]